MDAINTRLDKLYSLQQKFHVGNGRQNSSLPVSASKNSLQHIDNGDEDIEELEKEVARLPCPRQRKQADQLDYHPSEISKGNRKRDEEQTHPAGHSECEIRDCLRRKATLRHDGADKVSFLFSANKSTQLQPVSQVASGGEIARVMLSLKAMISGAVKLPTIIFDEIDTGVSGKIAEKMAEIMEEMGLQNRQVISITHLPQIAAMGSHHYKVLKEETGRMEPSAV